METGLIFRQQLQLVVYTPAIYHLTTGLPRDIHVGP